DAYLAFPPEPEELRAAGVDQVIVNTATDKPWSQYGCCMLATHREFVDKYPIATRRATRALLKAADFCASSPELTARILVEKKVTNRYDKALASMRELRFDVWRDHDPGDSMRFYGNRLYEVGMIKSSPNKLIARGYEARLLESLNKEIKV
ncbi:MAG: ABC transporter substrate-binding protein, partial [Burkholderiales bacterium]